jgi:hypothetical protein
MIRWQALLHHGSAIGLNQLTAQSSLDELMTPASGRYDKSGPFTAPMILLGCWLGIAFGHAYEKKYYSLLYFSDIAVAIGAVLGGAFAIAIWYAVKPSQRRWLMWIVLPAYAVIGLRMGNIAGKQIDWAIPGAVIGGVIGCLLGYVAGRAIASQPVLSE